jgi:hypothetical protein
MGTWRGGGRQRSEIEIRDREIRDKRSGAITVLISDLLISASRSLLPDL